MNENNKILLLLFIQIRQDRTNVNRVKQVLHLFQYPLSST